MVEPMVEPITEMKETHMWQIGYPPDNVIASTSLRERESLAAGR